MRIAQISTLARPVPPMGEGSVELLVHNITEELVRRGHEVTLFAVADSQTSATLCSPVATSYVTDAEKWDWRLYEMYNARVAFGRGDEFDVIHCHSYCHGLLFADFTETPSIHSFHTEPGPDAFYLASRTRNRHLLFCSRYQARRFNRLPDWSVVPHGIDVDSFAASVDSVDQGYLAFLGRFTPGKGVDTAVKLAHQHGIPLKLAAPRNAYYDENVAPLVDGELIEYVGEVRGLAKVRFLANARALIYPIRDPEPFGLVLIEAMASGLPVIALDCGAVGEIVLDGISGWLCRSEDELLLHYEEAAALDRNRIRGLARSRHSVTRMVDDLERLMQDVCRISPGV